MVRVALLSTQPGQNPLFSPLFGVAVAVVGGAEAGFYKCQRALYCGHFDYFRSEIGAICELVEPAQSSNSGSRMRQFAVDATQTVDKG